MKRVYISGPMTGIPDFNKPAFEEATRILRSRGCMVISPVELDTERGITIEPGQTHLDAEEYKALLKDDEHVITSGQLDALVLLPGWQHSTGCDREARLAIRLLINLYEWQPGLKTVKYLPAFAFREEVAEIGRAEQDYGVHVR